MSFDQTLIKLDLYGYTINLCYLLHNKKEIDPITPTICEVTADLVGYIFTDEKIIDESCINIKNQISCNCDHLSYTNNSWTSLEIYNQFDCYTNTVLDMLDTKSIIHVNLTGGIPVAHTFVLVHFDEWYMIDSFVGLYPSRLTMIEDVKLFIHNLHNAFKNREGIIKFYENFQHEIVSYVSDVVKDDPLSIGRSVIKYNFNNIEDNYATKLEQLLNEGYSLAKGNFDDDVLNSMLKCME